MTPEANFVYDQSSVTIGNCTNSNLSYPNGRLSYTTTTNSQGVALTATIQDYDPMGRVVGYWQATPLNCGSSLWTTLYGYDLAGDVAEWVHPAGFLITNTISNAMRVTNVASSWNDETHPGTLAQDITYSPLGSRQSGKWLAIRLRVHPVAGDLPI